VSGETHYRARRVPGRLADPEASRCGLAGKVTDWPAKVTCQRCRELGEADDPPVDRARWHTPLAGAVMFHRLLTSSIAVNGEDSHRKT
jgi:hypothetical protein